jgi:uncharacterized protein YndB with AHSA1/START domain
MRAIAVALSSALVASPAGAEIKSAAPGAFLLAYEGATDASPEDVFRALAKVGRWWSPDHTYSGDAGRLSLELRAGGCFCERWGEGQSVEHGRVNLVMEREGARTLRFVGGLGPLQELGVAGVMTIEASPAATGAVVKMTYRVSGDAALQLDMLAPLVDQVLSEQHQRLLAHLGAGAAGRKNKDE